MRTPGFIVPSAGMSMDDMRTILQQQAEQSDFTRFDPSEFDDAEVIQHFGVKGMKWGVHKAAKLVGPSEDHIKAATVRAKAKVIGVHALSNKDLQQIIKRMDLEVKFKDLKTVQHEQSLLGKGAKWVGRVATDILVNTVSSWFKAPWARGGGASHHPSGSHVRVINGSVVPQRQIGN